jgi:hypothetical protein
MTNKVALIIIYNHKYDKNIEVVEQVYQSRFSQIFHLVPFYSGDKENVIPIYENSFYFQGYVAQAFKSIYKKEFVHFIFIGDDLILNPLINENNYSILLNLTQDSCFLPEFTSLHEVPVNQYWSRIIQAYNYQTKNDGLECENEIPSFDEAMKLFNKFGLTLKPLVFDQIYKTQKFPLFSKHFRKYIRYFKWYFTRLKSNILKKTYSLKYPLVGSYSDIFIVSGNTIRKFSHYCGVFAASDLFVEIALPTAMVLSAEKIVTEKDIDLRGKALWTNKDMEELDRFNLSIADLLNNFPPDYLYLHPVKLSKWKK